MPSRRVGCPLYTKWLPTMCNPEPVPASRVPVSAPLPASCVDASTRVPASGAEASGEASFA